MDGCLPAFVALMLLRSAPAALALLPDGFGDLLPFIDPGGWLPSWLALAKEIPLPAVGGKVHRGDPKFAS